MENKGFNGYQKKDLETFTNSQNAKNNSIKRTLRCFMRIQ